MGGYSLGLLFTGGEHSTMEGEEEEKNEADLDSSSCDNALQQTCDIDIDHILLSQRCVRNELVLKCVYLSCSSFMFCFWLAFFLIQLDGMWRSRETLMTDFGHMMDDGRDFLYPAFYEVARNEETWTWDPDTLLLRVNTSIFIR